MSQENVEIVRDLLAEFFETHQAVRRLLAPDFVWDMRTFRGWPDAERYIGADDFDEFFASWVEPYEEWDMEVEDLVDAGADRVVALLAQRGRLRETDSWVNLRQGQVYTIREGKVSRIEVYASPDEALEAVGLSE